MAAKKTEKKNTKVGGNALAQRLGAVSTPKRANGSKSNGSVKSLDKNKKNQQTNPLLARIDALQKVNQQTNPLLARIDALQKVHNGQSRGSPQEQSNNNPWAQRIRISDSKHRPKGPSSSSSSSSSSSPKFKITPASITKQTQALQSARLRKQNKPQTPSKITNNLPKSNKNQSNQPRSQNIFKIKNASIPKFLKIKNLEYGTTVSDLKAVLESIGTIKIIKINDLESGSSMAEVVFNSESALENAHIQLNGALADGRKLKTEISNETEIPTQLNLRNGPRVYKS